ncbi:DEAD/DEAH box helicase [Vineibacter terrae]|uniref:DEAD/DEAH box helicase n=1 Tax=Vineibacter terrae TaxID=2586908 RepID=UPI002E325A7E|nr:DEAD/DEAH box helicase [Vineibacter terrae]HEX2889155.1 DEAD/DEAH box helicase [Vineibacter terrae]
MGFDLLGLGPDVLKAVADAGYTTPTPIQEQAIPYILMGRDVLGCAQTGTGKTAGFTLPMIEILASGRAKARMPRSLILEPTRELAAQVSESFETYGKHHKLSKALLIGGVSFDDQEKVLDRGVDVLIATPGRLLDHFERGKVLLNDVKILVIDEADRMLDMGFIPDVERIVSLVSQMRQTLFFSATMPPEIRRLADAFLMNPKEVTVARPATTASTVTQGLAIVPEHDKREALRRLIRSQEVKNALIFCNRKKDVDILYKSLAKHGFNVGGLHGDMSQPVRMETLERFKLGEIQLLVASDVAARGLDIDDMSHVFNFDVPFHPEDYVHRIGRTGRAGRSGVAFTLASPDDGKLVAAVERVIGQEIPRIAVPDMDAAELDQEGYDRRRSRGRGRGGRDRDRPRRERDAPVPQFRDSDRDGTDDLMQAPAHAHAATATPADEERTGDRGRSRRRRSERHAERGNRPPRDADRDGIDDLQPPAPAASEHREAPAEERRSRRRSDRDERRRDEHPHEERPREGRDRDRHHGRDRRRDRNWDRDDGPPVVGFGDFTPAFLSRPVPQRRRPNRSEDPPPVTEEAA